MIKSSQLALLKLLFAQRSRSVITWVIIWSLLGLLFAFVFKDLSKSAEENFKLYQSLPAGVLKTVNISSDYLTKPEKFLSGQFLTVYLLAGSIFSVFMGVGALGAKIENSTIVNLLSKPLSRTTLYLSQAFTSLLGIFTASALIGLIMYSEFNLAVDIPLSKGYFVATFVGSAIVFTWFAWLGQLLGLLVPKARAEAMGSALGVVSFFVNGLGSLEGVPTWIQKCSVFYYLNSAQLRDLYSLDATRLLVLIVSGVLILALGVFAFRRKQLYF